MHIELPNLQLYGWHVNEGVKRYDNYIELKSYKFKLLRKSIVNMVSKLSLTGGHGIFVFPV